MLSEVAKKDIEKQKRYKLIREGLESSVQEAPKPGFTKQEIVRSIAMLVNKTARMIRQNPEDRVWVEFYNDLGEFHTTLLKTLMKYGEDTE